MTTPQPPRGRGTESEALDNFRKRLDRRRAGLPAEGEPPGGGPQPAPSGAGGGVGWQPPGMSRLMQGGCRGCLANLALLAAIGGLAGALTLALVWLVALIDGPVNVVVLGIDERPTEPGPFRSDTMILTRFDPRLPRFAMLSIPRDLWITIPEVGPNRINTANFYGGPALAKSTVAENFGLPVQHYVKINFNGFVQIIDAMGGIDVVVSETLHDENYPTADYGVTTVHIEAGPHRFSGEEALIYARSRYSTSDFDRARRQQEILSAIQRRAFSPAIVFRLPAVLGAILGAVDTDIPLSRWATLGLTAVRAPSIERAVIGPSETVPFVTEGGAQVLLPNWDIINPILTRLFDA